MAHFLKHEPCPKCSSRDNLGVWSDGHKWCFGCGYYEPSPNSIKLAREKLQKGAKTSDLFPFIDADPNLPADAWKWLKKFGISDEEVKIWGVGFDYAKALLVFPIKEEEGGRIVANLCRNFGPSKSLRKYLYYGSKGLPPIIRRAGSDMTTGIFCEDILSAIKIGRSFTALPVFGASIDVDTLKWASERFNSVGVWLDRDMHHKVGKLAFRGSMLGSAKFFPVYSQEDPKCYPQEWIEKIVGISRNFS
jgi:Zn ribbon nucleic-acid-binding protein